MGTCDERQCRDVGEEDTGSHRSGVGYHDLDQQDDAVVANLTQSTVWFNRNMCSWPYLVEYRTSNEGVHIVSASLDDRTFTFIRQIKSEEGQLKIPIT